MKFSLFRSQDDRAETVGTISSKNNVQPAKTFISSADAAKSPSFPPYQSKKSDLELLETATSSGVQLKHLDKIDHAKVNEAEDDVRMSITTLLRRVWRQYRISCLADYWVREILACILASLCLVAIVVVLAVHQGRSLPKQPKVISINTLIAILNAIMKTALVVPVSEGISQLKWLWFFRTPRPLSHMEELDSASRGPRGAFLLLLKPRGYHLAYLGALITVLLLALDPFVQQVIQYHICLQIDSEVVARIPRTNNLTRGAYLVAPGWADLDTEMLLATSWPALGLDVDQFVHPVDCPSGNCTFPSDHGTTFETLGLCSACYDISESIERNETSGGYFIPNWKNSDQPNVGKLYLNISTPYVMFFSRKTLFFNSVFDELVTVDSLMLNVDSSCDLSHSQQCQKHPWAVRCSLYPCLKTFAATVAGNVYHEELTSTTPLRKTNISADEVTTTESLTWSLGTDTTFRRGIWHNCTISEENSDATPVQMTTNKTLHIHESFERVSRWYENDCTWVLDYVPALAINQRLSYMFDVNWLESTEGETLVSQGGDYPRYLYANGTATLESASKFFSDLAETMTSMIRSKGDSPASEYATGQVLQLQTCIGVRWPWLTLPAGVVSLVITFMVTVAVKCRVNKTWKGAWRSSALAPFFHGVDVNAEAAAVLGAATYRSDMDDTAREIYIHYVPDERGRFRVAPLEE